MTTKQQLVLFKLWHWQSAFTYILSPFCLTNQWFHTCLKTCNHEISFHNRKTSTEQFVTFQNLLWYLLKGIFLCFFVSIQQSFLSKVTPKIIWAMGKEKQNSVDLDSFLISYHKLCVSLVSDSVSYLHD